MRGYSLASLPLLKSRYWICNVQQTQGDDELPLPSAASRHSRRYVIDSISSSLTEDNNQPYTDNWDPWNIGQFSAPAPESDTRAWALLHTKSKIIIFSILPIPDIARCSPILSKAWTAALFLEATAVGKRFDRSDIVMKVAYPTLSLILVNLFTLLRWIGAAVKQSTLRSMNWETTCFLAVGSGT